MRFVLHCFGIFKSFKYGNSLKTFISVGNSGSLVYLCTISWKYVDNYLIWGCVLIHYYVLDLSFRESSSLFFVGDQLSPKILPATSGFSRHVSLSTKDDEQLKWFQIVQSLPFMSAKRSVFDTGHARWRAALKLQAASTMWILFLVLFKPFHILLIISGFLIASEAS